MQSWQLQLMMVLLDFAHGSGLAVSLGGESVSLARSLAAWVSDWLLEEWYRPHYRCEPEDSPHC